MFGPLIDRYLLSNHHRVVVELLPDPELAAAEEAEEKARLKAFQDKLVEQEVLEVIRTTQELKHRQVRDLGGPSEAQLHHRSLVNQ